MVSKLSWQTMKDELDRIMCDTCYGSGTVDDAEPGDIYFHEHTCPDCKGNGFEKGGEPRNLL